MAFLLSLLLVPESPRFLVAKGRMDEAISVLTRLFGAESAARVAAEIVTVYETVTLGQPKVREDSRGQVFGRFTRLREG